MEPSVRLMEHTVGLNIVDIVEHLNIAGHHNFVGYLAVRNFVLAASIRSLDTELAGKPRSDSVHIVDLDFEFDRRSIGSSFLLLFRMQTHQLVSESVSGWELL